MPGQSDDRDRIRRLRQAARERWGDRGGDAEAFAGALDSDDPEERAEAAWALAELAADPDRSARLPVETKLAPLLDDEDRWVRRGASWALATVADERPQRGRAAAAELTEGLTDDDPLVRENSVLAVAAVASEHPRAVEPALSRLAALARDGDGLARRYAAETFKRLLVELDAAGFPRTVEATPEFADLLPDDAGVVEVTDDPDETGSVRVRTGSGSRSTDDAGGDARDDSDPADGPPDRIPSPPGVDADRREFERLADLGEGPLTSRAKARTPGADGRHVVVVLRTLRSDADVDTAAVERAFRAWAEIDDHDHVAPVLARGTDPRPWVATEFMDGGTLRNDVGAVGFERALWYVHCVTAAVCHAHARGVVHGALRPGAVGLSRTLDGWPAPKVGGWGLGDPLAAVQSPPVPPAFAAPEHAAPDRFGRPDPSTDVYQLGALSYALFAGRPPFVGDAREVVRNVRDEDPAPVGEYAPGLPDEVDDLLGRALAKSKPARFEAAEDFRRELEVLLREYGPADSY